MLFPLHNIPAPSQGVAPVLTLESAVREAVSNHRGLAAARKDALAAQSATRSLQALANPEIHIAPALDQFNGTTEELLITQPLEVNGARSARGRASVAQARAKEAQVRTEQREVVAAVKSAYVELWRERELHSLAQTLTEISTALHRLAQKQVELGSRPGVDLTQTALETIRTRQQETQALARVRQAEAALNVALGRSPHLPVPELALSFPSSALPSVETSLANALAARTELSRETSLRDALQQETAMARAEGRPDIAPQFRSQYLTFQRPVRSDYGFSVAIRLPLVDWGARKNRIQQAQTATLAQEDRIEQVRQHIRLEVVQARTRLEAASVVLAAFAESLPQAKALLAAAQIGFEEGKTSVLAVLEAQRTYRTTRMEYTQAQAELALAQAEFARVLGDAS